MRAWVTTVLGPVGRSALGVTLAHEHVFADGRAYLEQPVGAEAIAAATCEVSAGTRDLLARHSCVNPSNVMLEDADTAVAELARFAAIGGRTLVDVTPESLGRRPDALAAVSRRTGVQIVAGCGPYCEYALAAHEAARDIDEIEQAIVRDLEEGIDGTGIRAGVIGEIGVNGQLRGEPRRSCLVTPTEERGLRAAARASQRTGVPIVVHQPNVPEAVEAIARVLESEQLDPGRVCLGHMSSVLDLELHAAMVARGYWIAYDNFGMNIENAYVTDATDSRRVRWLLELLGRGLGHRILVSHDVWSKIQLSAYGGGGYTHLHDSIVPSLRAHGIGQAQIEQLLVANPAEFFPTRSA